MTTTQERLADALREAVDITKTLRPFFKAIQHGHIGIPEQWEQVLAAHDAGQASAAEQAICPTCSGSRWLRVLCPDCTAPQALPTSAAEPVAWSVRFPDGSISEEWKPISSFAKYKELATPLGTGYQYVFAFTTPPPPRVSVPKLVLAAAMAERHGFDSGKAMADYLRAQGVEVVS